MTTEDRLDLLSARLRDVLILLAHAPVANTTIPDDQGAYQGNDRFISPDLRDEARSMMNEWDAADATPDAAT